MGVYASHPGHEISRRTDDEILRSLEGCDWTRSRVFGAHAGNKAQALSRLVLAGKVLKRVSPKAKGGIAKMAYEYKLPEEATHAD